MRRTTWLGWALGAGGSVAGGKADAPVKAVVLRSQRRDDPPVVSALVWTSISAAAFDMLVADVAILDLVDDVSDGFVRFAAVVLVIMVLATALPPLLRRVAGTQKRAAADPF